MSTGGNFPRPHSTSLVDPVPSLKRDVPYCFVLMSLGVMIERSPLVMLARTVRPSMPSDRDQKNADRAWGFHMIIFIRVVKYYTSMATFIVAARSWSDSLSRFRW